MTGFFAQTIVRWASQDFLRCPQWWNYAEVVSRLTGLWIPGCVASFSRSYLSRRTRSTRCGGCSDLNRPG